MRAIMVQGTSSGAGKTVLVAALCRIFSDMGYDVAPFKSQNMSGYSYRGDGFEISRAQAVQAVAARCDITADLNPVMLRPLGDDRSAVYVGGRYRRDMSAREYYAFSRTALGAISGSLSRLGNRDIIVIEGAGSPAEINLQKYDIANMRIAAMARAPVLLVSDIDRGGSFASLAGTMSLIEKRHRDRVRGFILNKFRGDPGILDPGIRKIRRITGVPVLGIIPMMDVGLPEEDSAGSGRTGWGGRRAELEEDIDRLAGAVRDSLDMKRIGAMAC